MLEGLVEVCRDFTAGRATSGHLLRSAYLVYVVLGHVGEAGANEGRVFGSSLLALFHKHSIFTNEF